MSNYSNDEIVNYLKNYIFDNFNLNELSDEELEEKIAELVQQQFAGQLLSLDEKVKLVNQVYSSIRGFGILDTIMSDDDITEVMINGPENIFIEKSGKLIRLKEHFESERRLEDVIQRIVGMAGREVNQANPIVDTRLPDGSRVNVVLPPIALCGPTVTIRKFSKTPMTIVLKYGYAPIEQYAKDGKQGPWTDIYALCATMYYLMSGRKIPEAKSRVKKDTIVMLSEMGVTIGKKQENAIMKGLSIWPDDRYQTMEELYNDVYM